MTNYSNPKGGLSFLFKQNDSTIHTTTKPTCITVLCKISFLFFHSHKKKNNNNQTPTKTNTATKKREEEECNIIHIQSRNKNV